MTHSNRSGEARTDAGVRLDTWLWAARFFKTRSLAKQAVETGRVELAGAACKPARELHVGAMLRVARGEECFEIEVLALSDRRGPAAVAQALTVNPKRRVRGAKPRANAPGPNARASGRPRASPTSARDG